MGLDNILLIPGIVDLRLWILGGGIWSDVGKWDDTQTWDDGA